MLQSKILIIRIVLRS